MTRETSVGAEVPGRRPPSAISGGDGAGWPTVVIDGGSLADVLGCLGVLALFAAGFLSAATVVLRRDLTGA